jgi:hypothetical protein
MLVKEHKVEEFLLGRHMGFTWKLTRHSTL